MLAQSFDVVPAVDVLERRAVRLSGGRRDAPTLDGGNPVDLARRYAAAGARRLHLVDLDGAFSGRPRPELVRDIAASTGLPVQVGGGYRTLEAVEAAIAAGADRVRVGTAALSPGFLEQAVARFGESLVVAVDVRDGRVAVDGWTQTSELGPAELARRCSELGVSRLLVTSAARDGSLAGPDLVLLREVLPAALPVLAAGGISSLDDLRSVRAELAALNEAASRLQARLELTDG